ncbi:hypothetical protein OB919_12635 [Halobacteria archaeon AArc-curdl1]|uniref:Uncharacterized protein n=1 Tax=Natronosalvus hydrolyticus TaxID=2979988 RepID=A0AAP2Z914_9EURY|nr:hypothetical protein [Halobacteria archaeon AArc-curdl1]
MRYEQFIPSKTHLYHLTGLLFRIYITVVVVVSLYSLMWVLEVAGYLDERIIATIWIAIAAMGTVFLVLLIPMYWSSRSKNR